MPGTVGAHRDRCARRPQPQWRGRAGQVEEPAFAVSFGDELLEPFEPFESPELEPESLPDELVPESLDDFDLVLAASLPFWPARLSVR